MDNALREYDDDKLPQQQAHPFRRPTTVPKIDVSNVHETQNSEVDVSNEPPTQRHTMSSRTQLRLLIDIVETRCASSDYWLATLAQGFDSSQGSS